MPAVPPGLPRYTAGSIRLPTLIGAAVLLAAAAAYLLQMRTAAEAETEQAPPPLPPAAVHQLGSFLVNVTTPGELRYLRVEVAAAIRGYQAAADEGDNGGHGKGQGAAKSHAEDEELPTLRAADEAVARDLIVKILSASSFESLRTTAGREQAKQQIKEALSQVLEDAEVESVLFLAFVMQ